MLNEFSKDPSKNHQIHQREISKLSVCAIIKAVNYITTLSQFLDNDSDVLNALDDVVQPFQIIISDLRTKQLCPHCGTHLYKSDLPQYDYICVFCDENF